MYIAQDMQDDFSCLKSRKQFQIRWRFITSLGTAFLLKLRITYMVKKFNTLECTQKFVVEFTRTTTGSV